MMIQLQKLVTDMLQTTALLHQWIMIKPAGSEAEREKVVNLLIIWCTSTAVHVSRLSCPNVHRGIEVPPSQLTATCIDCYTIAHNY